MPSFSMKDGVITVNETITGVGIKKLHEVLAHSIERENGRITHRVDFTNGGKAVVAWNEDGSGFNCELEQVNQTYSPDGDKEGCVTIMLYANQG